MFSMFCIFSSNMVAVCSFKRIYTVHILQFFSLLIVAILIDITSVMGFQSLSFSAEGESWPNHGMARLFFSQVWWLISEMEEERCTTEQSIGNQATEAPFLFGSPPFQSSRPYKHSSLCFHLQQRNHTHMLPSSQSLPSCYLWCFSIMTFATCSLPLWHEPDPIAALIQAQGWPNTCCVRPTRCVGIYQKNTK